MDEMKEEMEKILRTLKEKEVDFEEYHHEALENVLEREEKDLCFDAAICKNLFVTTRKRDRVFLVMVEAHKKADLHRLAQALGTTHLGFAPQELLAERLGQKPGAVGPLGILHDRQGTVEVVFDESLRTARRVAMHPSVNTATVVLPFARLEGLIRKNGNLIYFMNF